MESRPFGAGIVLFGALFVLSTAVPHAGAATLQEFSVAPGHVLLTIETGDYQIVDGPAGQRVIAEGFDRYMIPGAPLLPVRRFLVALPPGARAEKASLVSAETTILPGSYRVEACPPALPLPDLPGYETALARMMEEYEGFRESAYQSDAPFPEKVVWLDGSGGLRKYSYVSVAYCPFTYYPASGRIEAHRRVTAMVTYSIPSREADDAGRGDLLLADEKADAKAAELFCNFDEISGMYVSGAGTAKQAEETYDYIILTTAGLEEAVSASGFPAWKTALGHTVRTVRTTDAEITSQPGSDLAQKIRNFLRAQYGAWGIEYVLIVGDYATVPMRVCYPDPDFHVYDPSDPGLVAPGTPTDYYYADLSLPDDVSWDSDGDGYPGEHGDDDPDFLAEVAVGRIPVSDSARVAYTLEKTVAFEQDAGAWKNNALHAGAILFYENQDHSGHLFVDGATCLDSIERGLMSGWDVSRFSEQAGLSPSTFSWAPLTQAAFASAWRTGERAVVNWAGHGWCHAAARTVWAWDDGDGVPESDGSDGFYSYLFIEDGVSNLDDDHPSVVFAISCNVGYPEPNAYGNLGINLLTLPSWGSAVGMVSSSRPAAVTGDWMNTPGGSESICYEFNRTLIAEEARLGDALYDGKFHAHTHYGWDHVYEPMNLYNFNLYGDPALALGGISTGVAGGDSPQGTGELLLSPGRPNPFSSLAPVRFRLPVSSPARAAVYDIRGRRVRSLGLIEGEGAERVVTWNGVDDAGGAASPGVYFLFVEAAGERAVRKVVLIR